MSLFASSLRQGDLVTRAHTCNCIPHLTRLSPGCNKQPSGTLTEFSPPSPSSPDKQQHRKSFLTVQLVPHFHVIRASLAGSGCSNGGGETISVWTDSSWAVCGGSRPLHHDAGTTAHLYHNVPYGCHHGVCWDCVEPVSVLSQGKYKPFVLERKIQEIIWNYCHNRVDLLMENVCLSGHFGSSDSGERSRGFSVYCS